MNQIEDLLNAEARAQADIDEMHESLQDAAEERISELLNDPSARDAELFELIGASPEDTFLDYFAVPVFDRDPLWVAALSALTVAARMQAWIEFYGVDAIETFENNGQEIDDIRKKMDRADLEEAARLGIGKARINGEKERRRAAR